MGFLGFGSSCLGFCAGLRCVPPLSFGHFPRERGKPGLPFAPVALTLALSRRAGEGIRPWPMEVLVGVWGCERMWWLVIGCAMKVHSEIGFGFQELIYQRALGYEMRRQGISFERESDMPVFYDGVQVGTRRVDFFVEGVVLVELKAVSVPLDRLHVVQVRNYLEVFGLDVGLLLNFGRESLEVKRLRNRRGVV